LYIFDFYNLFSSLLTAQ